MEAEMPGISRRPWQVWVLLLYATMALVPIAIRLINMHMEIPNVPSSPNSSFYLRQVTQTVFESFICGYGIYAIWKRQLAGLVIVIALAFVAFYELWLIRLAGVPSPSLFEPAETNMEELGRELGGLITVGIQLFVLSLPMWSRATRQYFGWRSG